MTQEQFKSLDQKMKNSASIEELNTYLIEFLNNVAVPEEFYERDGVEHVYSKKDTTKLFKIKKYKLYNYWADKLSSVGVHVLLSDYPKLEAVVNEVRELNKISSDIHKKFNTHRKAELKRIKIASPSFQIVQSKLNNVLEEIRLLEEKRQLIQMQYDEWIDNTVYSIEKDAGFINPNIRLDELNKKLK